MANFVLVHGAWAGSRTYGEVPQMLEEAGHKVVNCTLRGLGSRQDELHRGITLSDHLDDVSEQIEAAGFDRFILAGHSYGGMVIAGVATRLGARIDAICYIDAFVPVDGQALYEINIDFDRYHFLDSQKSNPAMVPLLGNTSLKVVPGILGYHPLLTMLEAVHFTGEEAKIPRQAYIFATAFHGTPFQRFSDQRKDDPAWEYHEVETSHNVMAEAPHETVRILLGLAT